MGGRESKLLPGETFEAVYEAALVNSPKARALVNAYQLSVPPTPRAKALAEAEIWNACTAEDRKKIIRIDTYSSNFLATVLRFESSNSYIARSRTLGWEKRGANVDSAWELARQGKNSWLIKSLSYANKMAEAAWDKLEGKMDEASINREVNRKFEQAFKDYQEDAAIHEEEKRLAREAHALRKQQAGQGDAKVKVSGPSRAPRRNKGLDEILVDGDFQVSKDLWEEAEQALKEKINPFVKARLEGLDSEAGVGEILDNFYLDLRNTYQDLLTKIRRIRNLTGSKQVLEVKRDKIKWALEVLRVDVKRGWTREDLDVSFIKKQYKQMVNRFHPDKPTSDENTLARFQEVKKAYEVLQDSGLSL